MSAEEPDVEEEDLWRHQTRIVSWCFKRGELPSFKTRHAASFAAVYFLSSGSRSSEVSSKRTNTRIVTSVRMTNKNALSYPANEVILWSYDRAIDGRHLSAPRSDTNRSFDEETRAICRVHEVCRNSIHQTRMLFFLTPRYKSQTSR